jgi:site-specific recombinase XerD
MSASTVHRRGATLTGFLDWLLRTKKLDQHWERPPAPERGRRSAPRLAPSEALRILHRHVRQAVEEDDGLEDGVAARPHAATTLLSLSLMIATGTRVAETASVEVHRIDLRARSIGVTGKGRRDRMVYVPNPWLCRLIHAYVDARTQQGVSHPFLLFGRNRNAISTASLRYRLRTASRDAGLTSHVTPHMLRHAAATNLLDAGVDIRFVQRLLGHASLSTTEIYTHVLDGALRRKLEQADVLGHHFLR